MKRSLILLSVIVATPVFADSLSGFTDDPYLKQIKEDSIQKRATARKRVQDEIEARDKIASEVCAQETGLNYQHNSTMRSYLEEYGSSVYSQTADAMTLEAKRIDKRLMENPERREEDKACLIALKDYNTSSAKVLNEYVSNNRFDIATKKIGEFFKSAF